MTANHPFAAWIRSLAGLVALAGVFVLSACGGGSGAPNNPFAPAPQAPEPLAVLPASAVLYSGFPTILTVAGGTQPYYAFSSDSALAPVPAYVAGSTIAVLPAVVIGDAPITITVRDAAGAQATSSLTIKPAPLLNTLNVTPNLATCGTQAICSGQTASAGVIVMGPGGGGSPNRQVRFDVVSGAFGIRSANAALPLASTLTVVSDATGSAKVVLQAFNNATTQPAFLRATELTTGNQVTAQFTIVQFTDGSVILSVVPTTITISGVDNSKCSSGFKADYFIFGGTPPYQVLPNLVGIADIRLLLNPQDQTLAPGGFEVTTTGKCVQPLLITIVDATGLRTTAQFNNVVGDSKPFEPPATPLSVIPAAQTAVAPDSTSTSCSGDFKFIATGGTPPYNAIVSPARPVTVDGATITVSGANLGTTSVVIVDSSSPPKSATASVVCTAPAPPPTPPAGP
jgi:hypothetical protein